MGNILDLISKDIKRIGYDLDTIYGHIRAISRQSMVGYGVFLSILGVVFIFDPEIRMWMMSAHSIFSDQLFSLFHWYGKANLSITLIVILYFGGLILAKSRLRNTGRMLFESFILTGLIVTILKSIFGRWRPFTEHGSYSFQYLTLGPNEHLSLPSGDVAIAFALSSILAMSISNKGWKWVWFAFATITALGRVYHDQHWMSDVVLSAGIAVWISIHVFKGAPDYQK